MMVPDPRSQPEFLAALFLIVMVIAGAAAAGGEFASIWTLAVLGAAVFVIGVAGLCVLAYQASRRADGGLLRWLGRTVLVAIKLILDLDRDRDPL
jgi:hypothetical protein